VRRLLLFSLVTLGLTVLTPSTSVGAAADVHPEWGHTAAHGATIVKGCRGYTYTYALTPPDGYWALETFLIGPHGKQYGSGYFLTGSDPLAGPGSWRLCARSTRPGTYTIRARLTVDNVVESYDGWLPETTFRLRHRRR